MTLFFNQFIQPGELKREILVFHLLWHVWIQEYAQSFHKHHWDWGEAGPENPRCLSPSIRTHFHELSLPFREGPPALAIFHSCSGFLGSHDDSGTEVWGGVGGGQVQALTAFPSDGPCTVLRWQTPLSTVLAV